MNYNSNKTNIQHYFDNVEANIAQKWNNADGDWQADGDDFDEVGDDLGADAGFQYSQGGDWEADAGFQYASGQMPAIKSEPYIINIANTTAANITNVDILDYVNQIASTDTLAYGNTSGIVITTGISGVTYKQVLNAQLIMPYIVGLTYLQGTTNTTGQAGSPTSQILVPCSLIESLPNGSSSTRTMTFPVNPFQNQTSVNFSQMSFKVDTFLKLRIATVYAYTTAVIYLYPQQNATVGRSLAGANPVRGYAAPGVVGAQPLKLVGGGQRRPAPAQRRRIG